MFHREELTIVIESKSQESGKNVVTIMPLSFIRGIILDKQVTLSCQASVSLSEKSGPKYLSLGIIVKPQLKCSAHAEH